MARGRRQPLYLERDRYRRRRLTDAARVLPFAGAVLLVMPLLWADPGPGAEPRGTATDAVYLFVAWFVLVLCAAGLSAGLKRVLERGEDEEAAQDSEAG